MEFNKISSDCTEQMMNKIQCEYSNIESIIPKLSDLTLSWERIGENVCRGISNSRIHNEILNTPNRVADKKNVYDGRFSVFGVGIATSSEGEVYVCKIYKGYGCSTSRYRCNNPKFTRADHWGYDTHLDLLSIINNKIDVIIQRCVTKHGTREYMCKEVSYCLRSRQQSVKHDICLVRACQGSTIFLQRDKSGYAYH